MRRQLALYLCLLVVGCAVSCYQPTYAGPYICNPAMNGADCPDGWSCILGLCAPPGTPIPDLTMDLTVDMALDQAMRPTCAQQGMLLVMAHGAQTWACPGTFSAGSYASVCESLPGAHVCGQDPHDDTLLALLDCDTLPGFYMAQINSGATRDQQSMLYELQCDFVQSSTPRAIVGCGTGPGVTKAVGPDCHFLRDALVCPATGDWSCNSQEGLVDVAHTGTANGPGGVLCCVK